MAITIDFAQKYSHLICHDISKQRLRSYPNQPQIPEKYRKKFIHPENGFVKMFCEDYDGHFTPDEQKTYREMLRNNSEDIGINILDLMEGEGNDSE